MDYQRSFVVITRSPRIEYRRDYVSLPPDYGSSMYYKRQDIEAIMGTVHENLTTLDEKIHFTERLNSQEVVIKINLVTVFHNFGFVDRDYPNTTDPRVLDAVILFLKRYTGKIVIVESSGRGMPTRGAFKIAGIDRLAKHHNVGIICLEEQPVDQYVLPKARVMKRILVPRIFSDVVDGKAFYISMPKMKTNLYTDVTLGFKNSMGCLPYNLRQRDHNFNLDQKLVDILHLFQPDLVIIDGIVGGEGQCPAPVDPVDSRVIISGNNSVETDRVATRMMGFDPDNVKVTRIAREQGFGNPSVQVVGEQTVIPFRKADPSLLNDSFHELFPGVTALIGHQSERAPAVAGLRDVTPEIVRAMEMSCRGGCLASTRLGFEYLRYEGLNRAFELIVIIGTGVEIEGKTLYFDRHGQPYTLEDIRKLKPKKLAVGKCARAASGAVDFHLDGCMTYPNGAHMKIHKLSGEKCKIVNPRGPAFFPLAFAMLQMRLIRIRRLLARHYLDYRSVSEDSTAEPSGPSDEDKLLDHIKLDMPAMSMAEAFRLINAEIRETISTITG
jgi:uncharacterized protein (DUF362 family)